jgi:Predicted metal binding domain/WXG100 protein secretion system (Wss), protein YukD
MAGPHKITVTVVVSGARLSLTEGADQKVAHLIRQALQEAGIPHPKVEDWTLRFADGSAAIDPDLHIEQAGITDGATLFLDPDEGGGGEVAVTFGTPPAEPQPPPVLVDPDVSAKKLQRQLEDWEANEDLYRERGWQLLGRDGLDVDIAFTARLPIGPANNLVVIPLAIRLGFDNYDIWPPSLRVIDPLTRRSLEVPRVRAIDFDATDHAGVPLDLFVNGHPDTGLVFLCKAGTLEYHTHFEHSGDDWLLYRDQGFGSIGRLCDLLWRTAVRTVAGVNFAAQRTSNAELAQTSMVIEIRQDNPAVKAEPAGAQIPLDQLPPQMLAQLPPHIQALVSGAQGRR